MAEGFTPQSAFDQLKKSMKDLSPKDRGEALRDLVDSGKITAFVDRAGRVWEPADYVQMVAKTKQAILSVKAGHARGDWRKPGVAVFIYHVEAFQEAAD